MNKLPITRALAEFSLERGAEGLLPREQATRDAKVMGEILREATKNARKARWIGDVGGGIDIGIDCCMPEYGPECLDELPSCEDKAADRAQYVQGLCDEVKRTGKYYPHSSHEGYDYCPCGEPCAEATNPPKCDCVRHNVHEYQIQCDDRVKFGAVPLGNGKFHETCKINSWAVRGKHKNTVRYTGKCDYECCTDECPCSEIGKGYYGPNGSVCQKHPKTGKIIPCQPEESERKGLPCCYDIEGYEDMCRADWELVGCNIL